jgi:hypothetical protein
MNTQFGGIETASEINSQPTPVIEQATVTHVQPTVTHVQPTPVIEQPVAAPVQPPVTPIQQPIAAPIQQSVATPVQQPVAAPVQQPIATPVQQPVSSAQNIINVVSQNQQATEENFAPIIKTGQSPVCTMSPGKFDAFVKVLSVLDDHNVIIIENSEICQLINNGTAILMTDISNLINNGNKINLHILSPRKYIKYFKNIKGNSDISIIDDAPNQRYIVTNGDMTVYLPKQIETFTKDATPPDLTQIQPIGVTLEIDKETRNIISTMSNESVHVDLLIHENQFKAVYVPETAIFSFKQFVKEQIDDSIADLRLRSFSFLKVAGDEYKVTLGVINGNYWMMVLINTGFVVVSILETLQPVSDEKLII